MAAVVVVGSGIAGLVAALEAARHHAVTLVTHLFVHAGLAHVAGNMLFLWIFGDNVEDALGHARYAFFYFACGLVADDPTLAVAENGAGSRVHWVAEVTSLGGLLKMVPAGLIRSVGGRPGPDCSTVDPTVEDAYLLLRSRTKTGVTT